MKFTLFLCLLATTLFAAFPPAPEIPQKGTPALATDWVADIVTIAKAPGKFGGAEKSPDGMTLTTLQQPPNLYDLQARAVNKIALKKGDTLFIRFAARSLKADPFTGVTKMKTGFGRIVPPYEGSYRSEIGLTSDWQRYEIPFTCKNDFVLDEASITFQFGYAPQQIEIADLQLLDFGPAIAPTDLPRTKRYADAIAPEVVRREMDRIVQLRKELQAVKDPSPANGTILYVATTGTDKGDGSKAIPFANIPLALAATKPGDTVEVAAGTYREPRGIAIKTSGRKDAWIHIRAAAGARPKIITSSWSGFELRQGICYIEIEGFELEWADDPSIRGNKGSLVHGVGIAPMYASHHIRMLNNVIHGYGTGGICALDCDYLYLEGNVIYDTSKTSPYGGSAISLCRSFNSDDYAGYHHIVRRNICYDNELKVSTQASSGGNGKQLTDGNGIIIDVFNRSRKNPLKPHGEDKNGPLEPYKYRTLVENNLIYDNGGRGVHIFRSSNVDVINNTCYMNQKTPDINAGELTAIEGDHIVIANNIVYGRKEKRANTQDGSSSVIWANNLIFSADDTLIHDGLIQEDPLFVAPALDAKPEGFRLKPGSPAIGKGIVEIAPANDLAGTPRPAGKPIDLGAYQSAQ